MAIYNPQIGSGTLGSPQGVADRMRDLERMIAKLNGVKTYIGAGSIVGSHIAATAIVAGHIDAGSINADHIQALAINAGHMQADSITATNGAIANLAVKTANIQDGAILSAKIGDAQITTAKIGNAQIQTAHIQDAQITRTKILDGEIVNAKIGDAAITRAKIMDGEIITAKIADAQITNAKIANLDGDKINAGTLTADRLVATAASADTLLARLTHTGSLVASTGLSAVSARVGNLVIDTTFGGSIRVGDASGARIITDNTGITGYSDATTVSFKLDRSTGKVITMAGIGGPNLLWNSSYEDALTNGWTNEVTDSTANTSTDRVHGTRSLLLTKTVSTGTLSYSNAPRKVEGIPGAEYTLSYWAKINAGQSRNWRARIMFYNSSDAPIVGGDTSGASTLVNGTTWSRVKHTATAPAGTATVRVVLESVDSHLVNEAVMIDGAQLEQGSLMTAYAPRPDEILPSTVTSTEIADNAVGYGEIAAGAIRGSEQGGKVHILADSIGATEIQVTNLSAITANMGTLTSGRISGGTIDGNVLDAGSVRTSHLSVGAAAESLNGGFEDRAVTTDYTVPARWRKGLLYGTGASADSRRLDVTVNSGWRDTYIRSGDAALYIGGGGQSADWAAEPVPVMPGDVWTLTFWARSHNPVGGFYSGLWGGAEKNTNALQVWFQENATLTAAWTRYTFRYTIPTGTNWVFPHFLVYQSANAVSIDDVTFRRTSDTTDIRPGAITTTLIAAKAVTAAEFNATLGGSNMIHDPLFKVEPNGLGAWIQAAGAWAAAGDPTYPGGGRLVSTSTTSGDPYIRTASLMSVTPNNKYTLSAWATGSSGTPRLGIWWYDSASNFISSSSADFTYTAPWNVDDQRKKFTATSPSNASYAIIFMQALNHTSGTAYFSGPQFERGDYATTFSFGAPDGTFTGGTFRTATGGARVEMNASGLVKYDANGPVVSLGPTEGLDLQAGTVASPPTDRRLRWRYNNMSMLDINTTRNSVTTTSNFTTQRYAAGDDIISRFDARDEAGTQLAMLYVSTSTGYYGYAGASAYPSGAATIVDGNNNSSFLRNAEGLVSRVFRAGAQGVTGNGTQTVSMTIAHGLGKTPVSATAIANSFNLFCAVTAVDGSNITVAVTQYEAAAWSSAQTVYWMAWG